MIFGRKKDTSASICEYNINACGVMPSMEKPINLWDYVYCSFPGFVLWCWKMWNVKSERWLNLILKRERGEIPKKIFFLNIFILIKMIRRDVLRAGLLNSAPSCSSLDVPFFGLHTSAEQDRVADMNEWPLAPGEGITEKDPHPPCLSRLVS